MSQLITVIGRGHGGTRAMSHTLSQSGVYMGEPLNPSGDLLPPAEMYEACRVMAKYVTWQGGLSWDFSRLHTMPIDPRFTQLIESYLSPVLSSDAPRRGWKIPETTLCYPWIIRMFPEAYYIQWTRDPRDAILKQHMTDDLGDFGVEYERTDNLRLRRAISWKYQTELVRHTPPPAQVMHVRFEDFVNAQDETLERLEAFLGFELARIEVRPDSVGRYLSDDGEHDFPLFQDDLVALEYKTPSEVSR